MTHIESWIHYGEKMKIGDCDEVYYWENPISPGYTNDLCLFLCKTDDDIFSLSLATPRRLGLIEETENERDEDPDFYPDEINGEAVKRELGEYYIGYDFDSFPDPETDNYVTFNKFDEPSINLWLKKNKVHFLLEDRKSGVITSDT
tara:strand:- start:418 stop:855 length:438 start_codon:yes stop_codon:yes gene_type:complete